MRPEVWAPLAREVAMVTTSGEHQMVRRGDGWFAAEVDLAPGERYAFRLDGGPPLPDPRALWLPDGVHAPSAVVDPSLLQRATTWTGLDLRGAVLYELHAGTFTEAGTFDAAIERLDHLVGLGIEAVELMPVAAAPGGRGWGYDGVALYAADENYGGLAGLVRLVDACHDRGLGVVLDVVHNHFGPEGNYLSLFGPYFTDQHTTPWGDAVNLDGEGSAEVRRFLLDSARHWLVDVGVDGLRLDAVHALEDNSEEHFLAELSLNVARWADETGRPLSLIAESDLNQPSMMAPAGSGTWAAGMDAQWADDVHHALHSFFSGEQQGYYVDFGSAQVLAKALTRVFVHDGALSTYRGQEWGAPVDPDSPHYDGHSFVVFLQNHDQVGNRAVGDRFAQHASADLQAAAAALYLLGPFTPMLFMGEEWAASTPFPYFSHLGPELGPFVTEGRAREFEATGWSVPTPDPQAEETWRSAVLRWDERSEPAHARMLRWYRRLLQLRRTEPGVGSPDLSATRVEIIDDDTVVLHRGDVRVAATRGAGRDVELGGRLLASWDDGADLGGGRYRLRGPGAVIAVS
ncbi:malto-oligosyltrehalose trehalohydrolase [Tessaracoccus sp. MC1627]|uniref:malto-oligosyltrehalose trehalohydrolase n=1 Tax=Tessaracoccus sp. MC1627 TaxID=2760312 RepID=UPI0016011C0E|nr:malto-oligosyltrehalose trehalohydrolase [Tessaracoccus sp. MC1627]MBB1513901.1 malto-oligosyltrehalose trehalohydrolase [Tessaracoccus sp. MC1627]